MKLIVFVSDDVVGDPEAGMRGGEGGGGSVVHAPRAQNVRRSEVGRRRRRVTNLDVESWVARRTTDECSRNVELHFVYTFV